MHAHPLEYNSLFYYRKLDLLLQVRASNLLKGNSRALLYVSGATWSILVAFVAFIGKTFQNFRDFTWLFFILWRLLFHNFYRLRSARVPTRYYVTCNCFFKNTFCHFLDYGVYFEERVSFVIILLKHSSVLTVYWLDSFRWR